MRYLPLCLCALGGLLLILISRPMVLKRVPAESVNRTLAQSRLWDLWVLHESRLKGASNNEVFGM